MNKALRIGILIAVGSFVILALAYTVFIHTFNLFGDPEKVILETKCNPEGTTQATIFTLSGNAVTEQGIFVSVRNDCENDTKDHSEQIVLSAEYRIGSLFTNWLSNDTLEILFSHDIEPIIQLDRIEFESSLRPISVLYRHELESK